MKFKLSMMTFLMSGLMLASTATVMADNREEEVVPVTLANIESFEVENFQQLFTLDREPANAELAQYVKNALLKNKVLPYQSPGQAILHFDCGGFRCYKLDVRLTLGYDGPLLWKTSKITRLGLYNFERNRKMLADQIVQELEMAYQTSAKIRPEKIDISVD